MAFRSVCLRATASASALLLMVAASAAAEDARTRRVRPADMIADARAAGRSFQTVQPFRALPREDARYAAIRTALNDGVVLAFERDRSGALLDSGAEYVQMVLPALAGGEATVELELAKVEIVSPDFQVVTGATPARPVALPKALHYWGVVKDVPESLAAVSVFEDEIMAIYRTPADGAVVVGRLRGSERDHVLYAERDLTRANPFACRTPDDVATLLDAGGQDDLLLEAPESFIGGGVITASHPRIVRVYVEVDQDVFLNRGSLPATVNYVTGLFNQSAILYQNESIPIALSNMLVWTTTSPYAGLNDSNSLLSRFQQVRGVYDGDLGHLVALRTQAGGVAAGFNGFCNPNRTQSMAFSGIHATYSNVPTYSWTVQVFTHEMGHLMGSRHTHACVWNGNNTAIDGCAGFVEGSCQLPGYPAGGGTIMSYCHFAGRPGINFNNGFGPQPGNVIRNRFASASCLDVRMFASYVPQSGAPRTRFASTFANPPAFDFFYNEAAGNFEQRPGGPCNTGQNNPTYFLVHFENGGPVQSCSYQGSWDSAPTTCGPAEIDLINSERAFTLNTDLYEINPATCARTQPLRTIVPFGAQSWFNVNLVVNGMTHTRRLNFVKR